MTWRPVPSSNLEVSDTGDLRSLVYGEPRPYSSSTNSEGFRCTTWRHRGRMYGRLVHRLVLEAFVGPCPAGHFGDFADGDRRNCALSNLLWAPRRRPATPHKAQKLTRVAVRDILRRLGNGETYRAAGLAHNVSHVAVANVATGRAWGWYTGIVAGSPPPSPTTGGHPATQTAPPWRTNEGVRETLDRMKERR